MCAGYILSRRHWRRFPSRPLLCNGLARLSDLHPNAEHSQSSPNVEPRTRSLPAQTTDKAEHGRLSTECSRDVVGTSVPLDGEDHERLTVEEVSGRRRQGGPKVEERSDEEGVPHEPRVELFVFDFLALLARLGGLARLPNLEPSRDVEIRREVEAAGRQDLANGGAGMLQWFYPRSRGLIRSSVVQKIAVDGSGAEAIKGGRGEAVELDLEDATDRLDSVADEVVRR